jgi:hypothetical protein
MVVALQKPVVKFRGGRFFFDDSKANAPYRAVMARGVANLEGEADIAHSWDLAEALVMEGCVGWDGLEHPQLFAADVPGEPGEWRMVPLTYSEDAKRGLPVAWIWKIAEGYIAAVNDLGEDGSAPGAPPTESTPPG